MASQLTANRKRHHSLPPLLLFRCREVHFRKRNLSNRNSGGELLAAFLPFDPVAIIARFGRAQLAEQKQADTKT